MYNNSSGAWTWSMPRSRSRSSSAVASEPRSWSGSCTATGTSPSLTSPGSPWCPPPPSWPPWPPTPCSGWMCTTSVSVQTLGTITKIASSTSHKGEHSVKIGGLWQKKLYNGFYDKYQLSHVWRDDFRCFWNLLTGDFKEIQHKSSQTSRHVFGHVDTCHVCSEDVTWKPLRSRGILN